MTSPTQPTSLRVRAGYCLSDLGAEYSIFSSLLEDKLETSDGDPDLELMGVAIIGAVSVSAEPSLLLPYIVPARNKSLYGSYWLAVDTLASAMKDSDVADAASWLDSPSADDPSLTRLRDACVRLGARHLSQPGVRKPVIDACLRRLREYRRLFDDPEGDRAGLRPADRRDLALALAADAPDEMILMGVAGLGASDLLDHDDFEWLFGVYLDGIGDLRHIQVLLAHLYDPTRPAHADLVLNLPDDDPLVVGELAYWVQFIQFDSEEAKRLQALAERGRQRRQSNPRPDEVDSWIAGNLDLADNGDLEAFEHAIYLLLTRPGTKSIFDEFQPDLTKHPRWEELPLDLKARLIEGASNYLRVAKCNADRWLGKHLESRAARTAYRCLILLLRENPGLLDHMSSSVWREWAPAIIDWPCTMNGASQTDKSALLKHVVQHAGDEGRVAIVAVVDEALQFDDPINVETECAVLWNGHLGEQLVDRVRSSPASNFPFRLAEIVLKLDPLSVYDVLRSFLIKPALTENRDRAIFAFRNLLIEDADNQWAFLKQCFGDDRALAIDAALSTASSHRRATVRASSSTSADLYLWLSDLFPPDEDPDIDGVHMVSSREEVGRWRDSFLDSLRASGAVEEIQTIIIARPHITWLRGALLDAFAAAREKAWRPLPVRQLIEMNRRRDRLLVRDAKDLQWAVMTVLQGIQSRLVGETPESHLLWDTRVMRPKSEDEVSDYLLNRLRDSLRSDGVVVNREVQVRRNRPSGVPERTDLRVDCPFTSPDWPESTVICEVKGAWNQDLESDLGSQLVGRYMADVPGSAGIFIVLWPDIESWSRNAGASDRHLLETLDPVEVMGRLRSEADSATLSGQPVSVCNLQMPYLRQTT